jgi:phenylacetic acid degradation operon negative regulatory protein
MGRVRYAEVREGVWTRPDNLPPESAPAESWTVVDTQCSWWRGAPVDDPVSLAAALFSSEHWASRARALGARLDTVTGAIATGDDDVLAVGFVVGAAVLQHARRDPLLPPALLPPDWPGAALRASYVGFQKAFAASLTAAFGR